jgi:hypothetical protein
MSKEGKHHYIPVFYLKQWTGADGRLCEYSRPYDRVKPRRVHPDGTGYIHGLYSIPGLPPELEQVVETKFMRTTDNYAALALRILLSGATLQFSQDVRSGWSRFISSLVMRNPESVERSMLAGKAVYDQAREALEADYAKNRKATDPATYEEYAARNSPNPAGRAGAILMQRIIDSPMIGTWISSEVERTRIQ